MYKSIRKYDPNDHNIIKYGLEEDEFQAIVSYTSDDFYKIPFNNPDNNNPDVVKQRRLLRRALIKMSEKQIPPDEVYAVIKNNIPLVWKNNSFRSTSKTIQDGFIGKVVVKYRKPPIGAMISEFSEFEAEEEYLILPGHTVIVKDYYDGVFTVDTLEEEDARLSTDRISKVNRVTKPQLGEWRSKWDNIDPKTYKLEPKRVNMFFFNINILNDITTFGYNRFMMTNNMSELLALSSDDKAILLAMRTKDGDNILSLSLKHMGADSSDYINSLNKIGSLDDSIIDGYGRNIDMIIAIYNTNAEVEEPISEHDLTHKDIYGRSLIFYSNRNYYGDYDLHHDIYGSTPLHYRMRYNLDVNDNMLVNSSMEFISPVDGSTPITSHIYPGGHEINKVSLFRYLNKDTYKIEDKYSKSFKDISKSMRGYIYNVYYHSSINNDYKMRYKLSDREMSVLSYVLFITGDIVQARDINNIIIKLIKRQIQLTNMSTHKNIISVESGEINVYDIDDDSIVTLVPGNAAYLYDFPYNNKPNTIMVPKSQLADIHEDLKVFGYKHNKKVYDLVGLIESVLDSKSNNDISLYIGLMTSDGVSAIAGDLYNGSVKLIDHVLKYLSFRKINSIVRLDYMNRDVSGVLAVTGLRPTTMRHIDVNDYLSNNIDIFGCTPSFYLGENLNLKDKNNMNYYRWMFVNGYVLNPNRDVNYNDIAKDGTTVLTNFINFAPNPPDNAKYIKDKHGNTWWHAAAINGFKVTFDEPNNYGTKPSDYYYGYSN
jgi:hypothetical protein